MQIAVRGEMTVEQEDRRSWRAEGRLPSSRRVPTAPSVTLATLSASSSSAVSSPASSSSSSSSSHHSSISSTSAPPPIASRIVAPSSITTSAAAAAVSLTDPRNDINDGRNSTSLIDDNSSNNNVNWTPVARGHSLDFENNPRNVHAVSFPSTVGKSSQYSLPAVPFYVNSLPISQAEETPY